MQDKHNWNKVVQNPKNRNNIKPIINSRIKNGAYDSYKSVSSKIINVNGHNVRVTYI